MKPSHSIGLLVLSSGLWITSSGARDLANRAVAERSTGVDRGAVLGLLRKAGDAGDAEARRLLASLEEGVAEPGVESIGLNLSSQAGGNERAGQRLDMLRAKGVSVPFTTAGGAVPTDGDIVPTSRMDDAMAPGYHCHYLRPGQMWCHSAID